ncbi:MAG: maleylpyruvate isomerase family mycothiol-dependent enzyme [Chloroflexota bacterium]
MDQAIESLVNLLRNEREALVRDIAGLSHAQLERATPCAGWDVHDVVAHLAMGADIHEKMIANSLAGRLEPPFPMPDGQSDPRIAEVREAMAARREALHAAVRARGAATNLAEFNARCEAIERTLAGLVSADLGRDAWFWGMTVPLQMLFGVRASETIMHGSDVRRAVGITPWFSDAGATHMAGSTTPWLGNFFQPALAGDLAGSMLLRLPGSSHTLTVSSAGLAIGPDVPVAVAATLHTSEDIWSLLAWKRLSLAEAEADHGARVDGDRAMVQRLLDALVAP